MKAYMTVKEYADREGITVQAVYQQIKKEKLRCKKIGSMHLVEIEKSGQEQA